MNTARKLSLKKEVLAELSSDELTRVVGGNAPTNPVNHCLSVQECQHTEEPRCLAPSILPNTCLC